MARSLSIRIRQISYGTIHTPLETRRQDGIPTKRRTQARPPTPNTRQTYSSTHGTRLDHLYRQKSRLVACHVQMGRKLRQRMRQMSTKQNTYPPKQSPTIQNQRPSYGPTIRNRSHGSDHTTSQQSRTRRHSYDSRPRLHQSSPIPTLHNKHHRRRNCQTLSRQRVSMVRNPLKDHIRQGPSIYITLLDFVMSTPRDQPKHIHGLSPTNRRSLGTKEPMGGTIPTIRNQRFSR